MKVAICDDEKTQRQLIEKYVREWGQSSDICVRLFLYGSSEELLFHLEEEGGYDLLILDIEMGGMNGMELAAKLRAEHNEVPVLFITGFEQYMAQGYDVEALHYLLKPVRKEKLFEILDRLKMRKPEGKKILIKTDDGERALRAEEIRYAEAKGHYAELVLKDGSVLQTRLSIGDLSQLLLKEKRFVSCHRSYVVNLEHVASVSSAEVVLDGEKRIPLSRGSRKKVSEAFLSFYHND